MQQRALLAQEANSEKVSTTTGKLALLRFVRVDLRRLARLPEMRFRVLRCSFCVRGQGVQVQENAGAVDEQKAR